MSHRDIGTVSGRKRVTILPLQARKLTQAETGSPYTHHKDKGCKIVWYGYYLRKRGYRVTHIDSILGQEVQRHFLVRGDCKTHKVKVCHCAWVVGHHYEY